MTIKNLVDSFLEDIEKIRRYSSQTCRAYQNDLYQFLNYCNESGREEIKSITEKIIRKYIVNLNEQKLSGTSVSRKLSALRSFFEYLLKYNYISSSPLSGIVNPKTRRNLPEVISFEEFQKIPDEIEKVKKIRAIKESHLNSVDNAKLFLAIVEMLYSCALRVSELCSLNIGDIDTNNNLVRVIGKGSKIRIVPVGNESLKILNQYLLTRKKLNSKSPLFITSGGNRLYPRYVYKIVNKYLSLVSDIKKKSPHILRHSAATHMLDRGADLLAVKEILGHENLSTTQIYTHVSIERIKKIHKQAHPKS
jgi:integrase/recombinase XerC